MKVLLETGKADIESKDNFFRQTPLSWAVAQGYEKVVKLLIETGQADVQSANNRGETALRLAKREGSESIIKLLESHIPK